VRADAPTLVFGQHSNRGESHDAEAQLRRIEDHRGEQDVTDYPALEVGS
jgi:hypothetical protein